MASNFLESVLRRFGYIPARELSDKDIIHQEETKQLKEEVSSLKDKELILYLVGELLHNQNDRDHILGAIETDVILSKARVLTPYYGPRQTNVVEMRSFMEYLSKEVWGKVIDTPITDNIEIEEYLSSWNK